MASARAAWLIRTLVLSLFVLLLACETVVADAGVSAGPIATQLCVGTRADNCDVVSKGVTQPAYLGEVLQLTESLVHNLTTSDSRGSGSESLLRPGDVGIVSITFGCVRSGEAAVALLLSLSLGVQVKIVVRKVCSDKTLSLSQDVAVIPGVEVATPAGMQLLPRPKLPSLRLMVAPDVVVDGIVQPRFLLSVTQESQNTMNGSELQQVPESAKFLELYVQVTTDLLST